MPMISLNDVPLSTGSNYPPAYAAMVAGRSYLRLGRAGGLTQFGVNIAILAPGALSSLRHAHRSEDEFAMVLSGECTLVSDAGEWIMGVGDCAAFPAGAGERHHFVNHTGAEARLLVAGSSLPDERVTYGDDIDMLIVREGGVTQVLHRDGRPWAEGDR